VTGTLSLGTPLIGSGLAVTAPVQTTADCLRGAPLRWGSLRGASWVLFLKQSLSRRLRGLPGLGVVFGPNDSSGPGQSLDGCGWRWRAQRWCGSEYRQHRVLARLCGSSCRGCRLELFSTQRMKRPGPGRAQRVLFSAARSSTCGLFSAYLLYVHSEEIHGWEQPLEKVLAGWGLVWWLLTGIHEVEVHVSRFRAGTGEPCAAFHRGLVPLVRAPGEAPSLAVAAPSRPRVLPAMFAVLGWRRF